MNNVKRVLDKISDICGYISGWFVPVMVALIFVEVFMRYVLNKPPMVADEFSAYILVAMSYLAAAYAFKEGAHVRITVLTNQLPARARNWLRVVTLTAGLVCAVILTKSSYDYMASSFKLKMASATWIGVPLQGPQMTVAVGFTVLCLLIAVRLVDTVLRIRSGMSIEGKAG